jgi:transposase InsO family protein
MIRTEAQLPVSRFAELIDLPRRTYHYRLAKHRAGEPTKGPWPAPVVDRIEPVVAKYAGDWDAWGHRKIWALACHDGVDVGSASSVGRAMARRGLLQPVRYQAERRQLAQARKAVFVDPPDRRNRVWQMDFSEFETTTGGIWRIGGVCDYWAKPALAGRVAPTATASDLIATLERSIAVARWFAARPHFVHVRTRARSPQTNGVIERFFQSLKYERLYRHDIADGQALAAHVNDYLDTYNRIRPHENIDWQHPINRYQATPQPTPTLKLSDPESEQNS